MAGENSGDLQNLLRLLFWSFGIAIGNLVSTTFEKRCDHSHLRVDDPVQILLTLFWAATATADAPEEPGMPIHSFVSALCSLFSLHIFYPRFLVRRYLLILSLDSLGYLQP